MIVSRDLLKMFCRNIDEIPISELEQAFFKSGIEVEKIEYITSPYGLFYGEIKEYELIKGLKKKISKCKVFIPQKNKSFQIICGASNVKEGLKVLVALEGAKLLNGEKVIENKYLHDILSEGMICGHDELYKSELLNNQDNLSEIIELPDNFEIDREFNPEDFCLKDIIFYLSIPANRLDLSCVWGLSYELLKNFPKLIIDTNFFLENFNHQYFCRILKNNNFFMPKDNIESFQLLVYITTGQIFSIDNHGILNFHGALEVGKNKLSTKYMNPFMQNWVAFKLKEIFKFSYKDQIIDHIKFDIDLNKILYFFNISSEKKNQMINDVKEKLGRLDFKFSNNDRTIEISPWRNDLKNEYDFMQEVATFIDISDINVSSPSIIYEEKVDNSEVLAIEKTRSFWIEKNFCECNTFNLGEENKVKETNIFNIPNLAKISNPFSKKHHVFRTHALNDLIDILISNKNYYGKQYFPVFEIFETNNLDKNKNRAERYYTLNFLVPVHKDISYLNKKISCLDLYDLQSYLKRNLSFFNQNISFETAKNYSSNLFLEKYLLEIFNSNKESLGFLGVVNTSNVSDLVVFGAVVKLKFSEKSSKSIKEYSKFPPSYRDISIDITNSTKELREIFNILKNSLKNLKKVDLIDTYTHKDLISITLGLTFQSNEKTLNNEDIELDMKKLYKTIEDNGLRVR